MPFVICEGPNGSGKTSLINSLKKDGYTTLSSPNGTPLAQMLRPACRGTEPWIDIDKRVQFMLFSAARYDEYLRLVHNCPQIVFADRWWTSTYIYQCLLQGIEIPFLEYTKHPDENISMVILLDADDDVLINRVRDERQKNPTHGVCRWTQEEKEQKKIIHLYRNKLPPYLKSKGIDCRILDTTNTSMEDVKAHVLSLTYNMIIQQDNQTDGDTDAK